MSQMDINTLDNMLAELQIKKQTERNMTGQNVVIERTEESSIKLPKGMTYAQGREWLSRREKSDEQVVEIREVVPGFPADGLAAFHRTLKAIYGWTEAVPTPGFWGDTPPSIINIDTGVGKQEQFAYGRIQIPGIDGHLQLAVTANGLMIYAAIKGKHTDAINKVISITKASAARESLYKGRAIKTKLGENQPKFIDVDKVNEKDLILNDDVNAGVTTELFTPIAHSEMCRQWGIPLKRGVLLSGSFGTGKSFTSMVTAKLAAKHGWTYIYLEDITQITEAIKLARHYAPSVLFAEDLDRVVKGERDVSMDSILNTLDGVDGKDKEVIVVFTTNDSESIHPAMLRPGRIDSIIEFKAPDAKAAARLVLGYGRGLLEDDVNVERAATLMAGMVPAAIREVVERAKLAAIYRGSEMLNGDDLETAAKAMRNQMSLFSREQPKDTTWDTMAKHMGNVAIGVEALKLIQEGHVEEFDGQNGCGNPLCPVHGKKMN